MARDARLMSTYGLQITSWRDARCSRTIEFLGSATLGDVHAAIQTEFELDDDHLWAFYLSGDLGDLESEFVSDDVGSGRPAWDTELRSLDLAPGMRFLYRFDFGDELIHDITVVGVGDADGGAAYPRVVERIGKPPPQYPGLDDEEADDEIGADTAAPAHEPAPAAPDVSVPQPAPYRDPTAADLRRVRVARSHLKKGDHAAVERQLRRLLERRWVSGRVRDEAVPLLAEVLRATGREHEAKTLEADRRRQVAAVHPEIPYTVRRDGPKVGRNDPCPCGSGKKYKKCCGG